MISHVRLWIGAAAFQHKKPPVCHSETVVRLTLPSTLYDQFRIRTQK